MALQTASVSMGIRGEALASLANLSQQVVVIYELLQTIQHQQAKLIRHGGSKREGKYDSGNAICQFDVGTEY